MTGEGLVVGGWVVVRAVPLPPWLEGVEVPDLLTISDCIREDLPCPEPWLGGWFQDREEAGSAAFGVVGAEPLVVTVALPEDMVDDFVSEAGGDGATWFGTLCQRFPLPAGAEILGFGVVGAEACLDFHSWHCHGYAAEVSDALGITVNGRGLIPTLQEARRVLVWMLGRPMDEAPEPVPWTVVGLAVSDRRPTNPRR